VGVKWSQKRPNTNLELIIDTPEHIAIIMDGNRRWAKNKRLPYKLGHLKGAQNLVNTVQSAKEAGVKTLTVYAFSTENWSRSDDEVKTLFNLFETYLLKLQKTMIKNGVKFETIGDLEPLPESLKKIISKMKTLTSGATSINLVLALNYGGRNDILRSLKKLSQKVLVGDLHPDDLTEDMLSNHLDTANWKDPDLLIRTSGEKRISNFLLWQLSYSEIYTTDTLWPDFSKRHLLEAIACYCKRKRRRGI